MGNRAVEQGSALMRGEYDVAMTYMTPAYQSSPRAADYQRNRAGSGGWRGIDLKWVKCDLEYTVCDVRLMILTMRPPAVTVPIAIPLDDQWIKVGGQWYQYD